MRTTTIETIENCLVLLEIRCFSSMLPSMPKGEIVSMILNDTTLEEYIKH